MSTAVNIFITQAVRQGGIPFGITTNTDPVYSEPNMSVLMRSIAQLYAGKGREHELIGLPDEETMV